jgi:hypothetical protein
MKFKECNRDVHEMRKAITERFGFNTCKETVFTYRSMYLGILT